MAGFKAKDLDDAFTDVINEFLDRVEAHGQKALLLTWGEDDEGTEYSGYFGSQSTSRDELQRVLIQTAMGTDEDLAKMIRKFLSDQTDALRRASDE